MKSQAQFDRTSTFQSPGTHQSGAKHAKEFHTGGVVQTTSGVAGSGEELALTLEKVVSQLDIISRTLHVLEQRVSQNENSVALVQKYYRDARERT